MDQIGIPYARVDGVGRRVCPICGRRCVEEYDQDGELVTNTYGEHYEREHTEEGQMSRHKITSYRNVGA